jgi:hypothetical protein
MDGASPDPRLAIALARPRIILERHIWNDMKETRLLDVTMGGTKGTIFSR